MTALAGEAERSHMITSPSSCAPCFRVTAAPGPGPEEETWQSHQRIQDSTGHTWQSILYFRCRSTEGRSEGCLCNTTKLIQTDQLPQFLGQHSISALQGRKKPECMRTHICSHSQEAANSLPEGYMKPLGLALPSNGDELVKCLTKYCKLIFHLIIWHGP